MVSSFINLKKVCQYQWMQRDSNRKVTIKLIYVLLSVIYTIAILSTVLHSFYTKLPAQIQLQVLPVSIASCSHRLYDTKELCSSSFPWFWVGSGLAPGVMNNRPHYFHSLPLLPQLSHRYQIILLAWWQRHTEAPRPKVVTQQYGSREWTHDNWIASDMPTVRLSSHPATYIWGYM